MDPEKELTQTGKDLQDQIQPSREWSLNIQAGPECVVAMTQVLLIVSTKEAMGIPLSGEGLKWVVSNVARALLCPRRVTI